MEKVLVLSWKNQKKNAKCQSFACKEVCHVGLCSKFASVYYAVPNSLRIQSLKAQATKCSCRFPPLGPKDWDEEAWSCCDWQHWGGESLPDNHLGAGEVGEAAQVMGQVWVCAGRWIICSLSVTVALQPAYKPPPALWPRHHPSPFSCEVITQETGSPGASCFLE